MIDQKRILTLNIRKYMQTNGLRMRSMAEKMGFKTQQSLQNLLTGNANPSWLSLMALCNSTGVPLEKWFAPDEEIFGIEKEETADENEFLSQLKAYRKPIEYKDDVKVVFGKDDRYIEFNGRRLPTGDFNWNNLSAEYGEIAITVDLLVDSIEKKHVAAD